MGQDKTTMHWHGREQRYHLADMLGAFCNRVFISCRQEQANEIDPAYPVLPDSVEGSGPIVALMSAFSLYPDAAWLVVACDLPLLDAGTISSLVDSRDAGCMATTFISPFDGLPEPLITIWEPGAASVLTEHLSAGFKCPRKALIRNSHQVKLLSPANTDALLNANTPADREQANSKLHSRLQ
jgi:molybdopterin-guanine dinucleotide biosynthesis protein A